MFGVSWCDPLPDGRGSVLWEGASLRARFGFGGDRTDGRGVDEPLEDHFGVGEIIGDEVGAAGFEEGAVVSAGGDGEGAAAVGFGAAHVVDRVADDGDVGEVEVGAAQVAVALDGDGREVLAQGGFVRGIAAPDAHMEVFDVEARRGDFGGAGFGEVAGEKAQGDVLMRAQGVDEFGDAGEGVRLAGSGETAL